MQIRDRFVDGVAVLELSGRLAVNETPGLLRDSICDVVHRGARHVILDLAGVSYLDSTRLGELIAAHVTLIRDGARLTLSGTPQRVQELLTLSGLDRVFEQFESVEAAMKRIGAV